MEIARDMSEHIGEKFYCGDDDKKNQLLKRNDYFMTSGDKVRFFFDPCAYDENNQLKGGLLHILIYTWTIILAMSNIFSLLAMNYIQLSDMIISLIFSVREYMCALLDTITQDDIHGD